MCACDACSLLFLQHGETKYKRVPRDARFLRDFSLSDGQWESLLIPIGLAFFVGNSVEGRVLAMYPSPAGPTESLLPLETWQDIVQENPVLETWNRMWRRCWRIGWIAPPGEYFLAPIDKCYELVGLIRGELARPVRRDRGLA